MGRPAGSKNRTLEQISLDAEIEAQKARLKALEADKVALAAKVKVAQSRGR